jgi:hypothetical protein
MEQQTLVDGQELWVHEHQLWVHEHDLIVRNTSCRIRNMSWGLRKLNQWSGTGVEGSVTWFNGSGKRLYDQGTQVDCSGTWTNGSASKGLSGAPAGRLVIQSKNKLMSDCCGWFSNIAMSHCSTGLVSRTPVPGKLSEVLGYEMSPKAL